MRKYTALLLFVATLCKSATVTVCPTGCNTTSLQTAVSTLANCGDVIQVDHTQQYSNIQITNKSCTTGTPITVEPDRITFETNPFARTTPSHLGNMGQIVTANSNSALQGVLDGSNLPPSHWKFIAMSFSTSSSTFDLVGFNVNGEGLNSTEIANDITFDRCYFWMPTSGNFNLLGIQDVIRGDVTNLTVKNSFLGDGWLNGFTESHGIRMLTTSGPISILNTMIITSSESIFSGGAVPSYPTYIENGITAKYNYSWRPWKYNGDPLQPFASQYVTFAQNTPRTGPYTITSVSNTGLVVTSSSTGALIPGSLMTITGILGCTTANGTNLRITGITGDQFQLLNFPGCNSAYTSGGTANEFAATVCTKNLGEIKWALGVDFEYNGGENSWHDNQCGSQYNGFTDTTRLNWDGWPATTSLNTAVFSFTDTSHITWTGTYRIGGTDAQTTDTQDIGICISLPITGTECHKIASFSGATLITSTPFSAAPVGTYAGHISYTATANLTNVINAHNIYKNIDQSYTVLGTSYGNGVGNAGKGDTHNINNNLFFINISYIQGYNGFGLGSGEQADFDTALAPSNYTFDHNTIYYPNGIALGAFAYLNGTGCPTPSICATSIQPKFTTSNFTNNLLGVSASGGNGPFSGDGVNTIGDTVNSYFASSNVKNNAIPGATLGPAATGGNAISGNQLQTWSDPFGGGAAQNIFLVTSGPYLNAGTDGLSLGANWQLLPMITGIVVNGTTLTFTLNNQNNDIKNTQPVVLEISTSQNLQTDLGTYTVIPDLDPTIAANNDNSYRSNVTISGNTVTWPINGLSNGTTYYGRVMAYGNTEWFTFTASISPLNGNLGITGNASGSGKLVIQ